MLYFVPAKSAFRTSITDSHEAEAGTVFRELLYYRNCTWYERSLGRLH